MTRREILALFSAAPILAQDVTFSTDVKVVNVLVNVHDKSSGRIVRDLRQSDFKLEEDGRPQAIRYFSQQNDLELTLGLLIDTSGSQRYVLGEEREASRKFIRSIMREDKDLAFLIHFDQEIELLQDVTSSKRAMEASLEDVELSTPPRRPFPSGRGGRGPGRGPANSGPAGTALYDAVLLASDDMMRKQAGRKALILMSDGVDQGSKVSMNAAIEAAQRADALIYSILFGGSGYSPRFRVVFGGPVRGPMGVPGSVPMPPPGPTHPNGDRVLRKMSEQTGGSYFEVSEKSSLDDIFARIEEELRNQYSLGYTPAKPGKGFRKLKVSVGQKSLTVQARDGYYAD